MFPQPEVRAVIIGISDYQNISDLDYAHRDAEAFAEYLQSPSGGNIPADHIRLLLNEEATQMQMAMALDWLQEESRAGDRAYIYFSGHGDVEKKTSRQRGFLLTHDAPSTTYMAGGAFPIIFLQDIIATLTSEQEVQVVLIADACRAGKLAGNGIGGNHVTAEALSKSLDNEIKILSCQPKQLSQESARWGGGRGVFSYNLIEGLIGLANPLEGDEVVNLIEIRRYLEDQVSEATSYQQIPMVEGPPNFPLATIDPESLAELRNRKAREELSDAVAMKNKVPEQNLPDTSVWRLYLEFQEALLQKHLLYPTEGAAFSLYQKIKDATVIQPHRSNMKRDLAVALHDEAQQAINQYLESSPQELRRRWSNNQRYEYYPEYLGKAAELLGPDHFMYEDLITRQLYFEGVRLRLQGEREKDPELYRKALAKQEETIKREPSAAYAYNELGLLYRRLKEKEKAGTCFYQALEQSPTWILPMANLITNYTELGQLDSALRVGQRSLEIDSSFALTYHNLGFAYETLKQWPLAVSNYKKATELDPDYANSYYNLGFAYYHLKEYEQTEKAFLEYLRRMPEDAAVWSDAALIAGLLGKKAAVITYLQKAYSLAPENTDFLLKLTGALIEQGSTDQALDQLEKAVANGFKDREKLESAEQLTPIRSNKRFLDLLKKME
ncbi:MAG: tetratricopeptide repeat protein [Lewinella sp.]|nr:tetratricopeptide repeat protein [Lewinella sp.]